MGERFPSCQRLVRRTLDRHERTRSVSPRDSLRMNSTFIFPSALFDTNEERPWNSADTGSNYTLKCPVNPLDDPPYRTKAVHRWDETMSRPSRLSDRTLCMTARQGENDARTGQPKYRHYDVHRFDSVSSSVHLWRSFL